VIPVTSIGRPAAGLYISDAVGIGAEHAQESLRAHGPGADLRIVGFLNDAVARGPVLLEREDDLLKRLHYASELSSIGAVIKRRSACRSICCTRKRRRSAAVSRFQFTVASCATGWRRISPAMRRDSRLNSHVPAAPTPRRQWLHTSPACPRLKNA